MKLIKPQYIVTLVVSYLLFLLLTAPIHWWFPLVAQRLPAGVVVENVQGNFWRGQVDVQHPSVESVTVRWDAAVYKLALLRLALDYEVSGNNIDLVGAVSVTPFGIKIERMTGHVDENFVAPLMRRYQASVSGRLTVQQLAFDMGWNRSIGDADGRLVWSGGSAQMSINRSQQVYSVPMMTLTLRGDAEGWFGQVVGNQQQTFMALTLTPEGRAGVSVKRSMTEAMAIQVPGSSESIFDFSQQVF